MNKRIREKVYKRKFQREFARMMNYFLDRHIKPSRIKVNLYVENKEVEVLAGRAQGLEIKLKVYKKPQWEETDD